MAEERRAWVVEPITLVVGNTDYKVVPAPLKDVIRLEDTLQALVGGEWLVGDGDGGAWDLSCLLGRLQEAGYDTLKIAIPELEEEDFMECSLPQLRYVVENVLEINGLLWLKEWTKNTVGLLSGPMKEALLRALSDFLGAWMTAVGETASTKS